MTLPRDPTVVITGAASGLGRAFALELGRRGARLILGDIDAKGAEDTLRASQIGAQRGEALGCDVTKPDQVEALARLADERFGGADLLINNAGVAVAGFVGDVPLEDWNWVVNVNLFGVVHGCHAFVPRFKRRRRGHILNVASAAGLVSAPRMAPYNVTKAAVVALSETLASELRAHQVGVTVLCPTFFETKIMDRARTTNMSDRDHARTLRMMKRSKLQAPDVARLALQGVEENRLYVVPMADGRWMWRVKRLVPERFQGSLLPVAMSILGIQR